MANYRLFFAVCGIIHEIFQTPADVPPALPCLSPACSDVDMKSSSRESSNSIGTTANGEILYFPRLRVSGSARTCRVNFIHPARQCRIGYIVTRPFINDPPGDVIVPLMALSDSSSRRVGSRRRSPPREIPRDGHVPNLETSLLHSSISVPEIFCFCFFEQ